MAEGVAEAEIIPVSALNNFNIGGLFDRILAALPEGEPYYPKDALTDKTLRFFASEIVREKILLNYQKEIPYCVEVAVDEYHEEPTIDRDFGNDIRGTREPEGDSYRAQGE